MATRSLAYILNSSSILNGNHRRSTPPMSPTYVVTPPTAASLAAVERKPQPWPPPWPLQPQPAPKRKPAGT